MRGKDKWKIKTIGVFQKIKIKNKYEINDYDWADLLFRHKGPTLSPVFLLWALCAPSHNGNFLDLQHLQKAILSPISSMSIELTTFCSFFSMLGLTRPMAGVRAL